ncbi:MAG: hypothetical protein WBB48_00705 [Thermodesulfobacteriota bacterium]
MINYKIIPVLNNTTLYSKRLFGLTLLLFSSLILLNENAGAQDIVCPSNEIQQITEFMTEASTRPSINADGTRIAFSSTADITGGNPDGNNEIYLFDTTTAMFTQITDETAGDSSEPFINADGTRIAFQTLADINGGNPEGNRELYLFDTTTSMFTQITSNTAGDSEQAGLNADATLIVFETNSDINGGNPDGSSEIYLYDTTTSMFIQITDDASRDSHDPEISGDGTHVAFHSSADITGGNPDTNREMHLYNITTGIFMQITSTTGADNFQASINTNGTRIGFHSNADIDGGNSEGNIEVYFFDTTTGTFSQITDEISGISAGPLLNADGTRIALSSNADINGGNPEGNFEGYLIDTTLGVLIQLTDQPMGNSFPLSINAAGTRITFQSNADINGGNPDENNEVFIIDCYDPFPTLDVDIIGEGNGTVVTMPVGIDCEGDCTEDFAYQTLVALSAVPNIGSVFVGWTGSCSEDIADTSILLLEDSACTAEFALGKFTLNPIFPGLVDNINSISVENSIPTGNVAFIWGLRNDSFTVDGPVCNGLELGIRNPRLLSIVPSNEFARATHTFYIPSFGDFEFQVLLQAVDIESCRASNIISQIILKEPEG